MAEERQRPVLGVRVIQVSFQRELPVKKKKGSSAERRGVLDPGLLEQCISPFRAKTPYVKLFTLRGTNNLIFTDDQLLKTNRRLQSQPRSQGFSPPRRRKSLGARVLQSLVYMK